MSEKQGALRKSKKEKKDGTRKTKTPLYYKANKQAENGENRKEKKKDLLTFLLQQQKESSQMHAEGANKTDRRL
jgi:hypothetical protein